jgi:hypothetical protein
MTWQALEYWLGFELDKLGERHPIDLRSIAEDLESVIDEWYRIENATRTSLDKAIHAYATTRELPKLTDDEGRALAWRIGAAWDFANWAAKTPAWLGLSPAPNPPGNDPGAALIEWMLTTFWHSFARATTRDLIEDLLDDDSPRMRQAEDQKN